jgi:hypothetical protein
MAVKKVRKADGSAVFVRTGEGSGGGIVGNAPSPRTLRGISAPGQAPTALLDGLDWLAANPGIVVPYQPSVEADRLAFAMGAGGGVGAWLERRKARRELEEKFGPIDWSDRDLVPAPTFTAPAPQAPAQQSMTDTVTMSATAPSRSAATDPAALRAYSGQYGVLWLRGADGDFYRMADTARMLHCEVGDPGAAADSEWRHKEHVLVQYASYALRYQLDDVLFTPNSA